MKRKLIILGMIFLVLLSISAVSASDNKTNDEILADDGDYNAKIITKDFTTHYDSYDYLTVRVSTDGGFVKNLNVRAVNVKNNKPMSDVYTNEKGYCYPYFIGDAGVYKTQIKLVDDDYSAKPVMINVKITKAPIKLTAKKWVSTTKQYTTLKVTVKDKYDLPIWDGTVKFIINGKSYKVKVNHGVATKKIKLNKAKTYTYKAVFGSKNYKTKTVSSKVYVKKAKKTYTFKSGNYKIKIKYSKYVKLLDAKNNGKFKEFSFLAGKKYGIYPIHMYIGTSAKDMLYPKGDYIHVWIDDGRGMDGYISHKKINLYTLNP